MPDVLPPRDEAGLGARYGAQGGPALSHGLSTGLPAPFRTPVIETILAHRSVRRFSERALPEGLLEVLAAAAQSAPTSSNLQAMSIVAVEDAGRKTRLSALAGGQKQVAQAPLLLMFVADLSRLRAVATRAGAPADGLDYEELLILAVADAAFAAQNALTALESLGLGGCYIGAMRNHPREVAAEIGLPPGAFVVFGMTVGYPDPAVATDVKPRLGQSVVLHREQYRPADAAEIAAYDATMLAFRSEQQMSDTPWSVQASSRVKNAAALTGRHVLRETLQAMGFGAK